MSSFFGQCDPKFQPVPEDKKIETEPFLAAAKTFPSFFDMFGAAFKPVRSDIEGNLYKLEKAYKKNPEKCKTLYGMLEDEIATNSTKEKEAATTALIWLIRGFQYTLVVLKELLRTKSEAQPNDTTRQFCQTAYEQTLKAYHGWIVQKVFSVVSHAAPYRKDLVRAMARKDDSVTDEQVYTEMEEFVGVVEANIEAIKWMYSELKVDDTIKA